MNHVDRSDEFARSRSLVSDHALEVRSQQDRRDLVDGVDHLDFEPTHIVPDGLKVWAARMSDGFAVQGLVDSAGRTYISCALNGEHQTFDVEPEDAAEAFDHPFAYGCTLPL